MTDLSQYHVALVLHTARFGHRYVALPACASTNDEAARLAREGAPEGLVVVADTQSGGRGRLGRTWHSPPGENLYLSILLRPDRTPATLPPLTLMTGAVLARVLAETTGITPVLKWPNDVVVQPTDPQASPRKLAGVLTEMASEREHIRHVVVGIGLNVNGLDFPPELADRATSLRLCCGGTFDRGALLAAVLDAFEPAYDELLAHGPAAALTAWRRHGFLGSRCRVDSGGESIAGTAVDIDEAGALLVRDDGGQIRRVVSGEVH